MGSDEGEGGGIGKKEGWNKEEECMINRNSESEFWRNREDHHGERVSGKSKNTKMMEWKEDGMRMMWDE